MIKTPKERQAARSKRLKEGGSHRTSITISAEAYKALRQIVNTQATTQSQAIEHCILAAEGELL